MTANNQMIGKLQMWVLRVGLAWLAVSVLMTGAAGWSFGSGNVAKQALFAFGFPLITIGAAIILPFIEHARDKGAYFMAAMLIPAWMACTVGEGFGHLMIIASQRDSSTKTATVDKVNYENAKKSADEQEAKLTLLTNREKELRDANPFVTTVTPDGLKADLVVLNKQIADETARGGCKAKCNDWMTKKAAVEKQLAAVAAFNGIPEQIAAAKRGADNARAELAKLKMGHSDAASQTDVTAKLFFVSLNPEADQKETASIILELVFVAVFVIGPMTLIAIGVKDWDRKKQRSNGAISGIVGRLTSWVRGEEYQAPAPRPENHTPPATHTREIVRTDANVWSGLRDALRAA